jgi:hypothetical protein
LVIVWHWTGAGVDGILSQRATPDGFVITQLRPDSAASLAGLQVGDLIVARDGVAATDRQAYWTTRRVGQSEQLVVLSVVRRGATPGSPPDEVWLRLTPTISIPDQLALLVVLTLFNALTPAMALIILWARPRDVPARLFGLGVLALAPVALLFMWDKAVGQTLDPQWHWYVVFLFTRLTVLTRLHLFLSFPVRHPWFVRLEGLGPTWLGGGVGLLYVVLLVQLLVSLAKLFSQPMAFSSLEAPNAEAVAELNTTSLVLWAVVLSFVISGYRRAARPAASVGAVLIAWGSNTLNAAIGIAVQPVTEPIRWAAYLVQTSTTGLALVRYRLFEVSPFLRTALVYPLALGILIGAYDLLAGTLGRIAITLLGPEIGTNPLLAAVPLLIVVALLRPLRGRLQGVLERSLYRARRARSQFLEDATVAFDRAQPREVVAALLTTRAIERLNLSGAWVIAREPLIGVPPAPAPVEPLLEQLAGIAGPIALVQSDQELPSAPIQTVVAEGPVLEAWYRTGARVLIPLSAGAAPGADGGSGATWVGAWVIGRRQSDEPFEEEDLAVLAYVGRLAAFQLDYARLAATVSRHRLPDAPVRQQQPAAARSSAQHPG